MNVRYDDRFTQMKRSNAHEVTLRAVLGMTADAENTASIAHFNVCVCVCGGGGKNRASVPFTYTETAEHAEFIFKSSFCGLMFTDTSP